MIEPRWFATLLEGWTPGAPWARADLEKGCSLLAEISQLNGGDIARDADITDDERAAHAVRCADDAVQRQMAAYAQVGDAHIPGRYASVELRERDGLLDFLRKGELRPRVELNLATAEALVPLPGIGPVTAERIVKFREARGPFAEVGQVREVKGISKADFERLEPMVFLRTAEEKERIRSGPLETFRSEVSFPSYLRLVVPEGGTLHGAALAELEMVRAEVSISRYHLRRILPVTKASVAQQDLRRTQRLHELQAKGIGSATGTLIFDSQYEPFLRALLAECHTSLCMIMFFLRFLDEKSYPTDALVQALLAAKERGAEVRVILDIDEADDPYDSRHINKPAFDYLKGKGIQVTFDEPERVTHSKVIVVDKRHVVLGSHNWTAGSFYQYDDTSIYIDSPELGADFGRDFDLRWDKLKRRA